ncbi:MAG: 2-oxo acid dehydrogenase subunit E2 [Sandaracinaceae bacterium]|nr:2-oxo acid dehydrogenase subunit E2 [Sandaracinaceae bacterium]MBP7683752.1 2-oxo acid dehydrogenase subunit E2 [Deltaproteobacteria bacterium]
MPQLGESVVEGTVGKWLVSEGDAVAKDQPIVEILTDKADSEVPSPVAGVVRKIHAVADAVVSVGAVLCEIEAGATAGASPAASAPAAAPAPEKPAAAEAPSSPSVRKLARETGVDLVGVKGSGPSGRITADDVRSQGKAPAPSAPPAPSPAPLSASPRAESPLAAATGLMGARPSAFKVPAYRPAPGDQVIPFSRRRRIIADHMVYSKQTSPEVVTFAECDLDATARLRDKFKDQYKKEGVSLTYLAFTLAATARALREFPELNARVLDDAYVKLRDVNLGIAVDTPDGLVVPVIRNADELTVRGLARAVTDIAVRARDGKLTPDDLAGKTFSVTNPGLKGNLVGGAIISQPNVGILRLGTIKKRVVVVERDDQDLMAIHPVMYMALTYDHRIVDGVHANGFLYRISEILEQGDFEL